MLVLIVFELILKLGITALHINHAKKNINYLKFQVSSKAFNAY